jgi:hypothetical protein
MTIVSTGSLTLSDMNDAKQLSMFIGGSQQRQVAYDGVGTYNPNYASTNQVLTPQLRIAGGGSDISAQASATRWYYQVNGGGAVVQITASGTDYTLGSTQPVTLTLKTNLLTANNSMNYICEMDYIDPDTTFTVTSKADFQIYKITNGVNAVVATVSNENTTIPASSAGAVTSYSGTNADIKVYEGSTLLTYDNTFTNTATFNGKYKVTATATGVTKGTETGTGTTQYSMGVVSGMANATTTATVVFQIDGRTSAGATISISRTMNITKTNAGAGGSDSVIQYIVVPSTFSAKQDGTYYATSVSLNAFQVTGTATAVAYAGYVKIETSVKGDFTDTVVAVANTTLMTAGAYTWTVTAGIKAFKASLYTSSGGATAVDVGTCYIVQDGKNTVSIDVWTPLGNAIQNSTGSVVVEADLLDGVTSVPVGTPTYKWYLQDPTATTSSGGDTDGGNGFRLIPTVAQPTTATVSAPTTAGSTLTAGTYYVKYTWQGLTGETQGNTTQYTQAVVAGQGLSIVVPAFPTGVTQANVYVGTVTGDANLYYQGNITTSAGSLVISKPILTSGVKVPTSSTAVSTTYQLTVDAFAVAGMEVIKCVATYNSNKYTGVTTVLDVSDPISVTITGVDTFKNGVGTTTLKALCFQSGAEVDQTGTIYTYTWTLYDSNNNSITATYSTLNTGKTVTVDGRDFVGRANIICQVSK